VEEKRLGYRAHMEKEKKKFREQIVIVFAGREGQITARSGLMNPEKTENIFGGNRRRMGWKMGPR